MQIRLGEKMKVIRLKEAESTNSYAKDNIDNYEDKTVIIAEKQTAGRGRLNRSWVDLGPNNLFLSFILKPSDTFNEFYPNLTQYLSVVLCKVLEKYNLNAQIKWPNDVLIDNKKIAGILSETVMQGKILKGIILGIGVNLNANKEDIDSIPDKIATSLNLETGKTINLDEFLKKLTGEFFNGYETFLKTGFIGIKKDYLNRNCFLNKELHVKIFDKEKSGLAKSVNDRGELVLIKDNKESVLTIGDIL